MRALLAILLVACEQAPPSDPPTPPAPPPSPITPAPTPIPVTPPITPSPSPDLHPTILLRLTPTQLTANGKHLLDVTPSTTAVELDRAAFAALSTQAPDRSTRVIIEADKSLAYANVLALLEAAKRVGYAKIAFSVPPSP